MFSTGQLIFALFFVIAFIIIIAISYRKDIKKHKIYYKGSFKILLIFIAAIGTLFLIKYFTQN